MFKARREKLISKLKNKSLLILYSGNEIKSSGSNNYPFCLNRNFYYFTNITQPNSYLVIFKTDDNNVETFLFIDEYDEVKEKWFGKKITIDEAKNSSGIENVLTNNNLDNIKKIGKKAKYVYFDSSSDFDVIPEKIHAKKIDVLDFIRELKIIKEQAEIDNILKAIEITSFGLKSIRKTLKTAKFEYELYNAFIHEVMDHGTHELGFPPIIASGANATCLHYPTPYDRIEKNVLIINDVGAGHNYYSADVTRTYPSNGKFSEEQKKFYNIVLNTNKEIIKYIKPGVTIDELQNKTKELLFTGLKAINFISDEKDLIKYYYHGVSHHLGLDVHDDVDRNVPLKKGMVITVEPGLYIKELKIGIRIEDDVLVTEDGSKCLSITIPKEIKDIEKQFREENKK